MLNDQSFNEEDKKKFVEFLNFVVKNAEFKIKTDEVISYFKLLAHMQQSILPKIDANVFEIKKVVEKQKGKKK